MSSPRKAIVFLGDGMADEPLPELGGRTPLQAAHTPSMDRIAREGRSGTLLTLPEGFPTSSDVANMSVLGCDLATELCGRGPLEAASLGIALGPNDIAFRMNLVTEDQGGILRDYSGGQLRSDDACEAIRVLNAALGSASVHFHQGLSYRNLLILSGAQFNAEVHCDKPDDNHGNPTSEHLPRASSPAGETTAATLRDLISRSRDILKGMQAPGLRANAIWPWSGGRAGAIHRLTERYGVTAAVISAVDVIKGLGRLMGMDVVEVPGATGYIDTNYEGKADAALEAIRKHDFVFVHVEALDEVSHAQDLALKLKAIEDFDSRLIGRVLASLDPSVAVAVLPDHPVPLRTGKHTRTPVPVAIRRADWKPDSLQYYDELAAPSGALGALRARQFMDLLLGL
ncbi:MAG: cofactor-independent phosphoglycerate mutase [Spirochaetota bacterium]